MRNAAVLSTMLLCHGPVVLAAQTAAPWKLSEKPRVEIGIAEGDTNDELFDAGASVRLADGRIVVLNAGIAELRFFDAKGKFLFKTGRKGNGPGEYRSPVRLYYTHPDSLLVYDQSNDRESHLDTSGKFITSSDPPETTDMFRRDTWLYERNLVDGPAIAAERARLEPALDRLPAPPPGQYRYIKVDPWYRLWAREPGVPAQASQRWTVYSTTGQPIGTVTTPASFEIHQIGPDFLLGRARLDLDVEVIRLYTLTGAGAAPNKSYVTPATARAYTVSAGSPSVSEEVLTAMRAQVRHMMSQQEIHYSRAMTYTTDPTQLKLPEDRNITPHILHANSRGWALVVVHRAANALCGAAMGASPLNWSPGRVVCGEVRSRR
jgi:hypothetical protein